MKRITTLNHTVISGILLLVLTSLSVPSHAEDGICARVKIEIRQEMTLERQAFEAHMRINNGFDNITLDDVSIDVYFSDKNGAGVIASSDPNDTQALFFIRLDSKEGVDDIDGTGTVHPDSSADIRWLIIPAPGASNGLENGTLYYVGATLTYFINDEEYTTEVSPDYIFVKPMPELTLDYFIPTDVYGDDAFTPEIEPIVPFPLGVRVTNNGSGTAKNLKIESAQPQIVENEQGLLIGFEIEGSEVNGESVNPSLLVDFGDIAPNTCGTANWIMTCSLSGKFVEFTADISHSDELGGELTSLIDGTPRTHFLVKDVLTDLPGRDSVKDFLAQYGQGYKVYESDNVDTEVTDQSASSNFTGAGETYTLSTLVNLGFIYVKLSDPHRGRKSIREVTRSDGKMIRPENAWLSKTRDENNNWLYFINLFDANTTDTYTFSFEDPSAGPQPPVLQFIPDHTREEQQQLGFIVEASDPNGTVPAFSAAPLPVGAKFTDKGDGTAAFDWTPALGQAGLYPVTFTASDGELKATRSANIIITSSDSDNDGMPDYWEIKYFDTLEKDGTGDSDGDGISDIDEYHNSSEYKPILTVTTHKITDITPTGATAGGHVLSEGSPLTERGICWSDTSPPTVSDHKLTDISAETGDFTLPITDLESETQYYVRAYAVNNEGVKYGNLENFMTTAKANQPPVANAGPDQTVTEGDTVTLSASESSDPDPDDRITYQWNQTDGTAVPLSDPASVESAFLADVGFGESLIFELTVTDTGSLQDKDTVTINTEARYHSADYNPPDYKVSLSELLRVIQLYNKTFYHCDPDDEDGYAIGKGDESCIPHSSDYKPHDWRISLTELLRLIQFYNLSGYHRDTTDEDGFAPRKTEP